ncbi:alkaline phosphatase family protein [Halosimplex rubrum]|uniref:Alkaline phosphatase family protein n=1 Tax=Halosimplex rubrum TaxID=869889 RepID=A0A7D5TE50_9EURY|nr:alkaline phosphatase family protein [Halosimplex rubrum]QLH78916.1 alkaline phosphatase family protein [Halosimplex rubrum]
MTLVVLGLDALDPDLVDPDEHPNLVLDHHRAIETLVSHTGEPSTHELWPTIITGLTPADHGLELDDDGVAWGNPLLEAGSSVADYLLPDALQSRIGAWLLTNTGADAFRTPATYYADNDIATVFDGREATAIGVPNYVVDPDSEDREHNLRRSLGDLFERDPESTGGHTSSDPATFYEQCMEMAMVRIARARRGVRGGRHELVFAYTSGLDLIGHVTYDMPALQMAAYDELDEFVGELRADLDEGDELLLVSDHGLQDGVHTHEAMVAGTDRAMVEDIGSVLDVADAIDAELDATDHASREEDPERQRGDGTEVRDQLEDLGYL